MTDEFAFLGTSTADGWAEWTADNAVVDEGAVRLRRERLPAYVDPREIVALAATDSPVVDLDADDCGILHLLRASGHVERYDADAGRLDRLGCGAVGPAGGARALAVTPETIYVASAAESGDGVVTAVARYPEQRRWASTVAGATPVALADDGDRTFALFGTTDGGFLATVDPDGTVSTVVEGLADPLDVAVDAGGTGYLLAGDPPALGRVETAALDPASPITAPAWDAPVPAGATCLAAGERAELLVGRHAAAPGEATLFRVRPGGSEPLSSTDRDLDRLHLAGGLYAVEAGGRSVHAFEARLRYARHERTGDHVASVVRSFDSGERATEWHRVTLGISVDDPGTQLRLEYAATDDPVGGDGVDWRAVDPPNPFDALLEDAVGRYLWLRVELQGDRFGSPRLHALRAYFPRTSYLRYLPAIYRDEESRAFLERFLSIFESTFVGVEEDLSRITQYLDPAGVPPAFLDWLGEWLAVATDETWPEPARRDLLAHAPDLFRERGTPAGLLALLGLYLEHVADPSPAWEALRNRQLASVDDREGEELPPAKAAALRRRIESDVFLLEYGDLDCATGPGREAFERLLGCPQCFFVFVRPFVSDEQFETVQRLVDDNRPAHAVGRAVELEPSVVLGGHAYLGVNSLLPDRDLVVGEGALGRDSVLDARETAGRLGVRARVGEDTELS